MDTKKSPLVHEQWSYQWSVTTACSPLFAESPLKTIWMIYDGTIIASRFLEKGAFSRNTKTVSRRRPKQVLLLDMTAEGLLSWVKEPVMNSSSLALICGIGFFLQKKSNKWRIPSRRELALSRTGLISQTLPNLSALWKCFPHPSALLRLSLRRQNPRPHHRQEIIPKQSLSIETMSRNLDWMLDLEYYSVCLLYSFFTQGLRKSHTISHSSYL